MFELPLKRDFVNLNNSCVSDNLVIESEVNWASSRCHVQLTFEWNTKPVYEVRLRMFVTERHNKTRRFVELCSFSIFYKPEHVKTLQFPHVAHVNITFIKKRSDVIVQFVSTINSTIKVRQKTAKGSLFTVSDDE